MKRLGVLFIAMFFVLSARADEGMWLLPYLNRLNMDDMKAKGLELSAEEIYSVNGNSLKDAIVIFGRGCTGEVVSPEGLLLTNHHCGYGNIQQLSSVENDYLKNGFWAMNRGEEIPAPGLEVRFIRRIEDVTDAVLGKAAKMEIGKKRDDVVMENLDKVIRRYREEYPDLEISVKPYFGGNQYFMTAMEVFKDVRLVGTPPNAMGKFGGDTDNWMWPRHTDDFSMFRIYAGPDNKPAEYSKDNVPYKAPVHLKVSLKGYEPNDFAMVMGFPGSTERYMTTYEMQQMTDVENANRIFVRGERQKILMEDMLADDHVRLQYASKYASSSNYWKNAIGMNKALKDNGILAKKQAQEEKFAEWASADKKRKEYALALPAIEQAVTGKSEIDGVWLFLREALSMGMEIISVPRRVLSVIQLDENDNVNKNEVMEAVENFYKDFSEPTDRRVAKRMLAIVRENIPAAYLPSFYADIDTRFGGNIEAFVDNLYDNSIYASKEKLAVALDNYDQDVFENDPALAVQKSVNEKIAQLTAQKRPLDKQLAEWHRVYVKGLMEMDPDAKYYPDANFTIRLTYGEVMPYEPRDGVLYKYYTTLKGVIEKEDPSNPLEFTVPEKVKEAYANSDYGMYEQDGKLMTNFLTTNDITGGNSGSPVMNGRGELIGLAFDGNWEAMSGDIVFEPELQRCINVDIRYVLWTIDKFAGAGHLIEEMTIVR